MKKELSVECLRGAFSVCRLADADALPRMEKMMFAAVTDEEVSLVCPTERVPEHTTAREDGWCGFRFVGTLDFSLVGILFTAAEALKNASVPIFAVSTYNTDYIFVKEADRENAVAALSERFTVKEL